MREENYIAKKEEDDAKPKFQAVEIGRLTKPWEA